MLARLLPWLLLVSLAPGEVWAQRAQPLPDTRAAALEAGDSTRAPSPAAAVGASLIVPGAGQWLQGNRRWVPYLALEVWGWLRFRERRQDSRELTRRYQDLAWQVARRVSVGPRRDTVFEYYEALTEYGRSGQWDAQPGQEGLQPESDPATFNGQLWMLAKGLFFPRDTEYLPGSAQYEAALEYYRQRAITPNYAWAWGGSGLEQGVYAGLIADSDEAYRDGTRMLGVILANHVASVVDALVTAKLRALSGARAEVRSGLLPEGERTRLEAELLIRF